VSLFPCSGGLFDRRVNSGREWSRLGKKAKANAQLWYREFMTRDEAITKLWMKPSQSILKSPLGRVQGCYSHGLRWAARPIPSVTGLRRGLHARQALPDHRFYRDLRLAGDTHALRPVFGLMITTRCHQRDVRNAPLALPRRTDMLHAETVPPSADAPDGRFFHDQRSNDTKAR
jgi:hypothetical protein